MSKLKFACHLFLFRYEIIKRILTHPLCHSPIYTGNQLFSGRSLRTVTAVCHISLSRNAFSSSFSFSR